MIYRTIAFLIIAAALFSHAKQKKPSAIPAHPAKIGYDSLKWDIPLGEPYRKVLKNGLRAYIATDTKLPLVQITGYIRYGSLADQRGKEGECAFLARLMRTGGTSKYSADTLDALLDLLAMQISVSATESHLSFSASFLSEYTDTALDVLQQILFHPAFETAKIERERKITLESIMHRFDNPGPILSMAFQKAMYSNQATGRLATVESVKSISRKGLLALHKRVFRTENMIVAAAGRFSADSMAMRFEKLFPQSAAQPADSLFPPIALNPTTPSLVVHKPITQAYVRMGLPLFKRPHPDYYAVSVLNLILGGGGFTSRLGTKIRSDAGLTYSIYSQAESNYTYPGTFYIDFYTKTETFTKATGLALKEIEKIRLEGVTGDELANAKASLIEEFPSMFRSPFDIVSTYAWNEYYGRAADHFSTYPDKVRALTRDEIKRVAQTYLDTAKLTFTIVADTAALGRSVAAEGFSIKDRKQKTIMPEAIPKLP